MLKDDFCAGEHRRHFSIVEKDGKVECVVCGGTGNGKDGVNAVQDAQDEEEDDENVEETLAPPVSEGLIGDQIPQVSEDVDFESERHLVSQAIGKKMIEGG